MGMRQQQPHQLFARVSTGTDYGNFPGFHDMIDICKIVEPENKKTRWPRPAGLENPTRLTLAVLETFASARLAVLLALTHAGIASEQPFGFEQRTKRGVSRQQSASEAVAHRACL